MGSTACSDPFSFRIGIIFGLILIFRGQVKTNLYLLWSYLAISAWVTMLLSDQVSIFNIQQFNF